MQESSKLINNYKKVELIRDYYNLPISYNNSKDDDIYSILFKDKKMLLKRLSGYCQNL
jgi:hypothetical protein